MKIGDLIRRKDNVPNTFCLPGIYLIISDIWTDENGKEYPGFFLTVAGNGTFAPFYREWAITNMELVQ